MTLKRTLYPTAALLALSVAVLPSLLHADALPASVAGIEAITKPSKDVTLSFIHPGLVKEVAFKEGDAVKAGDTIAKEDSTEEEKALAIDKSNADDQTEYKLDQALLDQDNIDYQKYLKNPGSSQYEIDQAYQKVLVDKARIDKAEQTTVVAKLKVEETQALIDKLKIGSPIDGVVSDTYIHVGEVADGQAMKVMRVIQVDPLWVEAMVPILKARQLKDNDPADVYFMDGKNRPGKVVQVWKIGDSASGTIKVRIEVPNPEKLQPGENVHVTFSNDIAAAKGEN